MRVEYINPFVSAVLSVFRTMLGTELTRGQPFVKAGFQPRHQISGVIGLSGKARGTIVLSLDRDAALEATEVMTQERPSSINADVIDAVGELANMIAGSANWNPLSVYPPIDAPPVRYAAEYASPNPSTSAPRNVNGRLRNLPTTAAA